ncbi:MAG: type VI secretion system-associated protein TagF, partial [Gammaproteobacteria bacterium]
MFGIFNKESKPVQRAIRQDIVGCTGKLPVHPEFIKYNIKTRDAIALDKWIHEGVSLLNRRFGDKWKHQFKESPIHKFVFTGREENRTITGVINPSQDSSGRHYPFCGFISIDNPIYKELQSLLVHSYADYYDAVINLMIQDWTGLSAVNVTNSIDSTKLVSSNLTKGKLLDNTIELLKSHTMFDFWNDILPGSDLEQRATLVKSTISTLHTVARRSPSRVHWGIRLPLSSKINSAQYITFWLQLCESMLSGRTWSAHYFWNYPAPSFPAKLTVFFKPVSASYFSQLVDSSKHDNTVVDMLTEMENCTVDMAKMTHLVNQDEMTLMEALQQWRS